MKKGHILSGIVGGVFFAVPYLVLDMAILPATIMALFGFGAGSLIFGEKSEEVVVDGKIDLYETLKKAKEQNAEIYNMSKRIDDQSFVREILEVYEISKKIVGAIEKKPEKLGKSTNFFNYYLPVTVKILKKYDEIENQRLTSKDSMKFMKSTREMFVKIKAAFNEQLANIFQAEIIDTDAEMKVFKTMLKTDGFSDIDDIDISENKGGN